MDNKTLLLVLIVVLVVFIVLLAVLGIVFIVALRKRRPVIKVVMAPQAMQDVHAEDDEPEEAPAPAVAPVAAPAAETTEPVQQPVAQPKPAPEPEPEEEEDDDEEVTEYVTEGSERVSYNRSLTAKIAQLSNKSKEWYSQLKNEMLSYNKVKVRMSWKRETFRIGRMTVAKFMVRGKTLSMLFPVEPASYAGTKFSVRDVSNMSSMADTPTMYRIRKERRCKFAKEMIADIMKELKVYKNPAYEAQDFFIPYEGDMALMQRGLVKRVVSGSTKTFKIEEVEKEAAATDDGDKA
ncbi:MAG: hypothetical protein K2M47_05875 [Clostridiales bacterium]|nr:hypothetical protein [Clostridiales bacterium]MDE6201384.1 hypothetical protein [Clostridiales bacterium]